MSPMSSVRYSDRGETMDFGLFRTTQRFKLHSLELTQHRCMNRIGSILLTLFVLANSLVAAPSVESVFPISHEVSAESSTEIVVTFDASVRPESFDFSSFYVFGRWSGPAQGTLSFENDNTRVRFVSDRPFMAGEWVTVSLSKNIEGADGETMSRSYTWNFWIRSARHLSSSHR